VACTPEWETIKEALKRVVAAGLPKEQAKRDLCRAMADRKIHLQLTTVADPRLNLPELTFEYSEVSRHLSPKDIDWSNSRPSPDSRAWGPTPKNSAEPNSVFLSRNIGFWDRTIVLIEVRSAQVTRIFCHPREEPADIDPPPTRSQEAVDINRPAARPPAPKPPQGAMISAAFRAIKTLWPDGVPKELNAKDRNRQIRDWQKTNRVSESSDRTIQRALTPLGT